MSYSISSLLLCINSQLTVLPTLPQAFCPFPRTYTHETASYRELISEERASYQEKQTQGSEDPNEQTSSDAQLTAANAEPSQKPDSETQPMLTQQTMFSVSKMTFV